MVVVNDWHPGTGDGHRSSANTTGGKAQRGHEGRPNFCAMQEAEVLWDEREYERDERSRDYEDFDNRPNYSVGGID